ncbi:MAG TPA: translation initiation factor IF-2 [Chlamydiales bacterium]|nr:translation initiation factor IF-2 [Chlamydiales bacterium]
MTWLINSSIKSVKEKDNPLAKHLKLNIKNLQLAGAFKAKQPKSSESSEKIAPSSEKKESAADSESTKRFSRLKEDSTITSALKQAEKTLAKKEVEKEPISPKKKKTRIVQGPSVEESTEPSEPGISEPSSQPAPIKEEAAKPVSASAIPVSPTKEKEAEKKPEESTAPKFTAQPVSKPKEPPKEHRLKKKEEVRTFDSRDRQGLRDIDNEAWRKRRAFKPRYAHRVEEVIRPKSLTIRLPITIKELAQEMKLKASQLIAKLLMQGLTPTLNDYLSDEVVVQLLGHDFDCNITIDRTEEKRIQITDKTIRQEIESMDPDARMIRSPIVAFMGHVDHGKTSLIDAIRQSNRAANEAGAITQHIGAFKVTTKAGGVTILDTPGHEAFSEMRSRGANVTDIVILVIAGDEGIRTQTDEAIRQAREANVPILVALNKCDKSNFDAQKIYRELSDRELLPEAWGGTTITVNCSALTNQGIHELLEMIALQAEILELRACPNTRARGTVLESEMHKGMGAVATVLVQNGTLRKGDAFVYGHFSGRIKTIHDDLGRLIDEAGPSTPVKITGLSKLAIAGSEFIIVRNEKEARELADARAEGYHREMLTLSKKSSMEKMMAKKEDGEMKTLPVILRADVQGSLEALKNSLLKIHSKKVRLEIVSADVGEISESDIELASASKATILGFHTSIESHAADLIKQKHIPVYSQDVIYHLIDEIKIRMRSLLDKIEQETDCGALMVKAVFKSSQLGNIAGCQVTEGTVKRQNLIRQVRNKEIIWKGKIASLKRLKEDIKEVQKGFECGIVLEGQSDIKEGDILEAYEITYLEQDL